MKGWSSRDGEEGDFGGKEGWKEGGKEGGGRKELEMEKEGSEMGWEGRRALGIGTKERSERENSYYVYGTKTQGIPAMYKTVSALLRTDNTDIKKLKWS